MTRCAAKRRVMKNIFLLFGALVASLPACAASSVSEEEPVESAQSADVWRRRQRAGSRLGAAWTGKQITFPGGVGRIEAVVDDSAKIKIQLGGSICHLPWTDRFGANQRRAATSSSTRRTRRAMSPPLRSSGSSTSHVGYASPVWTETEVVLFGRFFQKRPHESWSRDEKLPLDAEGRAVYAVGRSERALQRARR